MNANQKLTINLWFDNQAEEAAAYYTSIFKNSTTKDKEKYPESGQEITQKKPGSVMTVEFELNGISFVALNGGPMFKFNEAVSIIVNCESQEEIDYYWERLGEGGDPKSHQCGWLKDKFVLSWQIVPRILSELFKTSDKEKRERVMSAMLKMKKLNIQGLKDA